MANKLELCIQVLQTRVRVVYQDALKLDADVIVSTDDTYLSASSGISKRIWEKADSPLHLPPPMPGKRAPKSPPESRRIPRLRREVRKFALPLAPGAVVVTSGGNLKAKYIFHAAALDIERRVGAQVMIGNIVQNVMSLACALGAETIVTPLLITETTRPDGSRAIVSQLTGVPEADILNVTLRSLARFLVATRGPLSVREVTLALYSEPDEPGRVSESEIVQDLAALRGEVAGWITQCAPINAWMLQMLPLTGMIAGQTDQERALLAMLEEQIRLGQGRLHELFAFSIAEAGAQAEQERPFDEEEYNQSMARLEAKKQQAEEDQKNQNELLKLYRKREDILERQIAAAGGENRADAELIIDLEDTQKSIEQCEHDLNQAKVDLDESQKGIDELKARKARLEALPLSLPQLAASAPEAQPLPAAA